MKFSGITVLLAFVALSLNLNLAAADNPPLGQSKSLGILEPSRCKKALGVIGLGIGFALGLAAENPQPGLDLSGVTLSAGLLYTFLRLKGNDIPPLAGGLLRPVIFLAGMPHSFLSFAVLRNGALSRRPTPPTLMDRALDFSSDGSEETLPSSPSSSEPMEKRNE